MAELSVAWTRKDGNFVLADLDAQYTTFIQKIYGLGLKMKIRLVLADFFLQKWLVLVQPEREKMKTLF